MTTLPNMGLVLPTRGDAGAGAWGDTLDENATLVDAHDHSTGKGTRVTTAGLNINADLPFSSLYAPTQLHRVQFSSIAAAGLTGSHTKSLFVSDGTGGLATNELYWLTNAGNNVQITSGNSLNISLVGAIGGDYSSVSAQLNYDDAGKRYTFKEGTSDSNGWARLASGDLRLYPFGGSGTFFVGQAAPGGIASSYTMTWPTALPAGNQLLMVDSAGTITAPTTAALAANSHIQVSGTGLYKHGSTELCIDGSEYRPDNNTTYVTFSQPGFVTGFSGVCTLRAPIRLPVGRRILTWRQFYNVAGSGATISGKLRRIQLTTATVTDVASSSFSDNTGSALESSTMSSINHTILTGEAYFIEITASNASHQIYGSILTYDTP